MKTKRLKIVVLMLLTLFASVNVFSQDKFKINIPSFYENESVFDKVKAELKDDLNLINFEEEENLETISLEPQDPAQTVLFIRNMLAIGAGVGFGDNQFLWTLHAAYYMQLMMFTQSALYASIGVAYSGGNYDDFSENLFDIQLKVLMFTAISKLMEVRLIYGPMFSYGFGNQKYDDGSYNYNDKLKQFTAALVLGFQLMIATNWSLGLQTSLFAYQNQTWTPEDGGSDIKSNSTFGLINSSNIFAVSIFFHLGNMSK